MVKAKRVPASLIKLELTPTKTTAKVTRPRGARSRYFFIKVPKKPVFSIKAVAAIITRTSFIGGYPIKISGYFVIR